MLSPNRWSICTLQVRNIALSPFLTSDISSFRVKLLATLTDNKNRVQIPGFCKSHKSSQLPLANTSYVWTDESVRPESEEETSNYELLSKITHKAPAILESRWREPSLTIHTVEVSGPKSESSNSIRHSLVVW